MKTNLIYSSIFLLILPFVSFAQTKESLENMVYGLGACVEEGQSAFKTYFFPNGKAISKCIGDCGEDPQVLEGNWKIAGDNVEIKYHTEWGTRGGGQVTTSSSTTIHEYYVAAKRALNSTEKIYKPWDEKERSCEEFYGHNRKYDVHVFLRENGRETYPETSEQILDPSKLEQYSKAELRIMRNEIFARYRYSFKSKDLREYFNERGFYGGLKDVSIFLSDIEKANVENIRKVEKQK